MYNLVDGTTFNERYEIASFQGNILDVATVFDNGIMDIISDKRYVQTTDYIANYMSELIENRESKKFHEGLNFFEKNGFISPIKQKYFENEVKNKKMCGALGIHIASSTLPVLMGSLKKHMDLKNFEEVLITWMLYINNGETSHQIENFALKIFNTDFKCYDRLLKKYKDINRFMDLPKLNKSNKTRLDRTDKELLNIIIEQAIASCDIFYHGNESRALEILCDYLRMSYADATKKIDSIKQGQTYASEIALFSGISFSQYFSSLLGGVEKSIALSKYDIENDFCRKERDKRKQIIVNTSKTVLREVALNLSVNKKSNIEMIKNLVIKLTTNNGSKRFMELAERGKEMELDLL